MALVPPPLARTSACSSASAIPAPLVLAPSRSLLYDRFCPASVPSGFDRSYRLARPLALLSPGSGSFPFGHGTGAALQTRTPDVAARAKRGQGTKKSGKGGGNGRSPGKEKGCGAVLEKGEEGEGGEGEGEAGAEADPGGEAEGDLSSEGRGGEGQSAVDSTSKKGGAGAKDRLVVSAGDPVDGKIQVQIQVPGKTTQAVYDKTLQELAKNCPPVPGARMSKGGKVTKVEPAVVLRLVGQKRVTGFVVNEVVNSTLATFVEERGLNAEKEAKTLQSAEELAALFAPGKPFAFDAELVLLEEKAAEDVVASSV